MAKAKVLGSRGAASPKIDGVGRERAQRRPRARRAARDPRALRSAAALRPPMPRPRRSRRCRRRSRCRPGSRAPARRRGSGGRRARAVRCAKTIAPDALRPAELVGREGQRRRRPSAAMSTAILPAACTASRWSSAAVPRARAAAASATGWITPVSLLASLHRDQRPAGRRKRVQPRLEPVEIDDAVRRRRGSSRPPPAGKRWPSQHARVLGRADEQQRSQSRPAVAGGSPGAEHGVVRLGAAAGEDDVAWPWRRPGAATCVARRLDGGPGRPALGMDRGGIARQRQRARHRLAPPPAAAARWHYGRDRCASRLPCRSIS